MIKGRSVLSVMVLLAAVIPAMCSRAAAGPSLTVAPGDRISIKIIGYKDLDGDFDVRADSTVMLPLVGPVPVGGLPGARAESLVTEALWQDLLSRPQVLVTIRHHVCVLGEVRLPGTYFVDGSERVTEMLAKAGGPTSSAKLKAVRVSREGEAVKVNMAAALERGETVAGVGLHSGDVVYVPRSRSIFDLRVLTALISAAYVTVSLIDRINRD